MTRLHRTDRDPAARRTQPSPSSPTSPTRALGPGRRDLRAARPGRRRGRRALPARRPHGRPGRPDGVPDHGLRAAPRGSCWPARARASRPSTRSGSTPSGTGTRIDYTADIRLGRPAPAASSRSWAAPSRRSPGCAPGCSLALEASRHSAADDVGARMKVAVVGAGHQRPDGAPTPCADGPRGPPVRARGRCRRPRQDRRGRRAGRGPVAVDTGFIVYNERTYPRFIGLLRRARASRRSRPTCRSARPAGPAASSSARAGPRAVRPARRARAPRPLADARRHPALLPRRPRAGSTRARPTADDAGRLPRRRAATGRRSATTSWSRSPRRSGRPAPDRILDFPVDYLLRFLDNHGLIGLGKRPSGGPSGAARTTTCERHRRASAARLRPRPATRSLGVTPRRGTAPRSRTRDGAASASTPSSWPPTPTTRWRLLGDADERERAALGGFEYTTNEVVLHTDDGVLPRRGGRLGVVERRPGRLPAAGRRS